jgi:hypothetical protein
MYAIKEHFYELSLKKYKEDIQAPQPRCKRKMTNLIAAGCTSDKMDILIFLFHIYKMATYEEFLYAIEFWKNT